MATEKKAMFVRFKMDKNVVFILHKKRMNKNEWRERFNRLFKLIWDMPGIFFKSYWINQEKGEWGAFYIFDSEKELQEYLTSFLWVWAIPSLFGAAEEINILEPGPIICKKAVTQPGNTWITE